MLTKKLKENVYTSLKELGLTEAEVNLYMISLSLGPSPINTLAKHLLISRPNVYKVIQSLEKRGLAKPYEKGKYARKFVVEPPTVVLEKLRQKREMIERVDSGLVADLPDLLALYHQGETPTKIKVIQGRDQFIKIHYQSLEESKDEILYFGAVDDFVGFISWPTDQKWMKKRLKKGLYVKILTLDGELARFFQKNEAAEKRETRILSGMKPFSVSFQLFGNKAVIWQPKAPLALLIEDQFIVEMFRSMFYKLWETAVNVAG